MGSKLLAITLAAAYFVGGVCRVACSIEMSAPGSVVSPAEAPKEMEACHHQHREPIQNGDKHGPSGPCCVGHSDDSAVLLSSPPAVEFRAVAYEPAAPAPIPSAPFQPLAFAANHDPPPSDPQVLGFSPQSPRAPPASVVL